MTEYINVTVQTTQPRKISVKPSTVAPNLQITVDPTEQNAKISRDWAIGEGLIQNEDYSSKTWAGESKSSADLSKMYSEAASLDLTNLENRIIEYDEQLNTTITEGLENINTSVTSGVETIETLQANSIAEITTNKEAALSDITTAKTNALTNIETNLNNATSEINTNRTNTLAQISTLANTSISDINATAKSYDNLTYKNITNCITEIPQRIKYTLENGTLTIKAGSVVIVPYGTEDLTSQYPVGATFINDNFKIYDTQFTDGKFFVWAELVVDLVSPATTVTDTQERLVEVRLTTNSFQAVIKTISSTTAYTGTGNCTNYRTDLNLVQIYEAGNFTNIVASLPLLKVKANNVNLFGLISQVFNGMGYIGSVKWLDKDVKMLLSDGFNPDGTYKSVEYTQPELITYTGGNAQTTYNVMYHPNDIVVDFNMSISQEKNTFEVDSLGDVSIADTSFGVAYVRNENRFYVHVANTTNWIPVKGCRIEAHTNSDTNGNIDSFNPKQPIRVADAQDVVKKSGDTMAGTLNLTGMTGDTSQLRIVNGPYGLMFRQDSNNFYMLLTNSGDPYGTWNSLRPLTIRLSDGKISLPTYGTISKAKNGYCKLDNGLIIQWGTRSAISHDKTGSITFPVAFSSASSYAFTENSALSTGSTSGSVSSSVVTSYKNTGVTLLQDCGTDSGARWIAIGY